MPTYEYECRNCKNRFELFQNIKADTVTQCPKCRSEAKRLIGTGAGIIFKGSGFYETDYKRKPDKERPARKQENTAAPCPMKQECKECHGQD